MRSVAKYAVALVLLMLSSCRGRQDADMSAVRVAVLRGPSAVETVQMMDSLSRCAAPDISVTVYDEPVKLRGGMLDGTVDYAILPMTMAALLYNKGLDFRLVAVPIWGGLYLCGTDSSVVEPDDLRGRTVHVMERGMTPDILLRNLLSAGGLDPERDLTLDYRFPTHIDLANAAMAGLCDICVLPEPYLSQVLAVNESMHILIDLEQEWRRLHGCTLPETAFLCRGGCCADPSIERVISAFRRSAQWTKAHPDSAAVLAAAFGINPDTSAIRTSIGRSHFNVVSAADAESEVKRYLGVFLQNAPEAIGGKIPDEEFFVR